MANRMKGFSRGKFPRQEDSSQLTVVFDACCSVDLELNGVVEGLVKEGVCKKALLIGGTQHPKSFRMSLEGLNRSPRDILEILTNIFQGFNRQDRSFFGGVSYGTPYFDDGHIIIGGIKSNGKVKPTSGPAL